MVATERMKAFDVQEELKEIKLEKEALKSALRLVEEELRALHMRETFKASSSSSSRPPSTSSSEIAIKSPVHSSDEEEDYDKVDVGESTIDQTVPLSTATTSEEEVISAVTAPSSPDPVGTPTNQRSQTMSSEEEVSKSLQPSEMDLSKAVVSSDSAKTISAPSVLSEETSAWADTPSSSPASPVSKSPTQSSTIYHTAALHALR
jgi:hypothetical protein